MNQTHATHTPGPWRQGMPHGACMANIYDKKHLCIAEVGVFGCPVEQEANARLIAAAPDLLTALRAIYGAHIAPPGATIGEARLCGMFAELARAAIAKAEGNA